MLADQEVELTNSVQFPLNKSYQSLTSPTDISVDYSKTITIPATQHNNRVLGNAYRLDKVFNNEGNNENLGLYMNSMKRIPAKLLCNGELLLDGYAKYVSASETNGIISYNINIFGAVGRVFQSLRDVVLSADKLSDEQKAEPDGGEKYILDDGIYVNSVINRNLVKECWEYTGDPLVGYNTIPDILGFAPANRGLYDDFESNSGVGFERMTVGDGTAVSIEDAIKAVWIDNLKKLGYTDENAEAHVDAIDWSSIIGDGVSEHMLRQVRSYEQKPYIYFCRLMKMYQRKCRDLTGYEIELDPLWFNANNPYWSRICYMFDYLAGRGVNDSNTTPFTGYHNSQYKSVVNSGNWEGYSNSVSYSDFDVKVTELGEISTVPFNILFINKQQANDSDPLWSGKGNIYDSVIELSPRGYITAKFTFTNAKGDTKTFDWWGAMNKDVAVHDTKYNRNNFNYIYNETAIDKTNRILTGTTALQIPLMNLGKFDTVGLKLSIEVTVWHPMSSSNNYEIYNKAFIYRHRIPIKGSTSYNRFEPTINNANYTVTFPNTEVYANWRYSTVCKLKNLYTKEEPLFDVILQYTKMFGLIWVPDYLNKKIKIMTRQQYFNNAEFIDWTDKFDSTKTSTIEPVSFNAKYVNFNYDTVDGYRYTGYKNRYGVEYGGKKLKTKYEFDNKSTDLFKGIHPSCASTKSYIDLHKLIDWDTTSTITTMQTPINMIDCEDIDQKKSITLRNWYFRCDNLDLGDNEYIISDVSDNEKRDGKYYWLDNSYAVVERFATEVYTMPVFSPVFNSESQFINVPAKSYGLLFNCPNEDSTQDKSITAAQGNYIYDLYWRDYINERYNSNNKKLTAYFMLSYSDYNQFDFNKFVVFNNQLFIVNKIIDFNPNTNESTKVELIQVNNIDAYTSQLNLFPVIGSTRNGIAIDTTRDWGSYTVEFRANPSPESYEIIHNRTLNAGELITVEDVETYGLTTAVTISYEGLKSSYSGVLRLSGQGYSYDFPIEINY